MMVMSRLLILAGVESLRDRHYAYSSCSRCYSKVLFDGDTDNWICIKCRSNRPNVLRRYRMNFRIADDVRLANVTVFGHNLDKFFGCTADEFYRHLESLSRTYPQLIDENLVDSIIEETFVGSRFLFGFKLPQAQRREDAGNDQSSDLILSNDDGSLLPDGLPNSEEMVSGTVAWQMLFPCSNNNFTTVLATLRKTVDDFGSSGCLNSVVNESVLFTETMPLLSQSSCVESDCIGFVEDTEQSLVLSCDQDACSNIEPKQFTERRSCSFSSVRSPRHMPCTSVAESPLPITATNKPILTNIRRAHFKTIDTYTQCNSTRLSQHRPISGVLKRNIHDSGFCSAVLTGKNENVLGKFNETNDQKSNDVSDLNISGDPKRLKRESEKNSPSFTFDESSVDEIEICRAASVISQEHRVFSDDFSFKHCITASSVSHEIKKRQILQNSPSSQLNVAVNSPAQKLSCTLDFVEAPYSEDLETFLKDCEFSKRLTCQTFEGLASDSKRVHRLESIVCDSLSEMKDRDWEQPYSEDLEEFLMGYDKSDDKRSQVHLQPINNSSVLQQMPAQDSFVKDTVPSKPLENACAHACSLSVSGYSDELFSLWSDDFEQQVADSSVPENPEKSVGHCPLQQLLTESVRKHSSVHSCTTNPTKNLRRNPLHISPGQSQTEQFDTVKNGEINDITSLNGTKENVEPCVQLCYASDTSNSSSSMLFGKNKNSLRGVRKSTRKTTCGTATPPVICVKDTPILKGYLKYRTPVNAISNSSKFLTNACDKFSSKTLHKKVMGNCATRTNAVVFDHSTKKARNGTVATPANHSFDLFQSPHSIRQSGLRLPGSTQFHFSSTPLSTAGVCKQSQVTVGDFPHRLADCNNIAVSPDMHQADPLSPDCLPATFVGVSQHPCRSNSYQDKTSATSMISPELFGNSLQRHSSEPSPGGAVCSWITENRKGTPIECNLLNLSHAVNGDLTRSDNSGQNFNQSEDLFGDSADVFLD